MRDGEPTVRRQEAVRSGRTIAVLLLVLAVALVAAGLASRWAELGPEIAARLDRMTTLVQPAQSDPEDLEGIVDAYYRAVEQYESEEAFRLADVYVRRAPGDAYGYAMRGYVDWWRGRCHEAMGDMDRALRLEPDYGYAYFVRGSCRFATGQLLAAEQDARAALSHAQDDGEVFQAHVLQVWLSYAQGHFAAARAAFLGARGKGGGGDLPVAAYWLAHLREGEAFRGDLQAPDGTGWQARLAIDVFAGREPLSDLQHAAERDGLAAFYLAQFALVEGREEDAERLLHNFVEGDFTTDVEYAVARAQIGSP